MIETYPLSWPIGYKRNTFRKSSAFKQTSEKAQYFLQNELRKIGASKIIISSNVQTRKDGYLFSDVATARISDPGVALYFNYKSKDVAMCCDKYERPWENIYALGKAIEGLRTIVRHDVSEFLDRAFTGFKALSETTEFNAFQILGIPPGSGELDIKTAYRKLAQIHHPDAGGSATKFDRITKAYQQAIGSLK